MLRALTRGAFPLFLLLFIGLGIAGIDRSCLDAADSAYLASAEAVSRGLMPYRDFLAAHPPLLFLLGAPLATLDEGVLPFRVFSVVIGAGIGLAAWWLAWRVTADRWIALAAGVLTLFAPLGLFFSRLFLNDSLVALLSLGAVILLLKSTTRRVALAGALCLLGTLAKLTFLPLLAAFLVHLLIRDRSRALLFGAIAIGGCLATAGALELLTGGAYLENILNAQASKGLGLANFTDGLRRLWEMDWPLIVAALAGIAVAVRDNDLEDGGPRLRLLLMWLAASLAPVLTLPADGHDINLFQPAEPALALFAAWGLVGLARSRRAPALAAVLVFLALALPGWLDRDRDFFFRSNAAETAAIVAAIRDGSSDCQEVLVGGCYALEAGRPVMGQYFDPFLWEEKYQRGDLEAIAKMEELQRGLAGEPPGPIVLVTGSLTATLLQPGLNEHYRQELESAANPPVTLWLPAAAGDSG